MAAPDENDQWHQAAQASFSEMLARRADWVTSSIVLLEANATMLQQRDDEYVGRCRPEDEAPVDKTLCVAAACAFLETLP